MFAGVTGTMQRVLEREISAKHATEVCPSQELKNLGLAKKLANSMIGIECLVSCTLEVGAFGSILNIGISLWNSLP